MTNPTTTPGEAWSMTGSPRASGEGMIAPVTPLSSTARPAGATARSNDDERATGMRALYERTHADMVRFAAFLTGDPGRADDLAQEAFVRVYDAWDRIDDRDRLDAYLKSTLVNLVRASHRREQVARRRGQPHLTVVASAEDTAMGRVGREEVLAAVAALPLRQRAAVRENGEYELKLALEGVPAGTWVHIRVTNSAIDIVHELEVQRPAEEPEVGFTADAAFTECDSTPPFNEYWGTAKPGSRIVISSPYGGKEPTVCEQGSWEARVEFAGAPIGETFVVPVKSVAAGQAKEFAMTALTPG